MLGKLGVINKYILIYWIFIKNGLIMMMEYRANFFINFAVECLNLFLKILYVLIIFKAGITIDNISEDEIMLYVGISILFSGVIFSTFLNNFNRLQDYVRNGDLDLLIIKPISLQFIVTMRHVDFSGLIPNIVGGAIMITISLSKLNLSLGIIDMIIIGGLIISSLCIAYSIFLIPAVLSLWIVKTWGFYDSIVGSLMEFNNLPMQIYSKSIINIGVFIIPVLVISNFPALQLINRMEPMYLIWAIVSPIILFLISRWFFRFAIRHYVSASS